MFKKKKQEPRITWVMNAVHQDGTGMKVTPTGVLNDRMTVDELEQLVMESTSKMFAKIKEDMVGHDVEVGVFTTNFIHVIHEDENIGNEQWQKSKQQILGNDWVK